MLVFSRKALKLDTAKNQIGKVQLLRKPTIAIISLIVVVTIAMGILRLVAYQSNDPTSPLAAASGLVDIIVVVIMTTFVVMMFAIGLWFLFFLSKQHGTTIKSATLKVRASSMHPK